MRWLISIAASVLLLAPAASSVADGFDDVVAGVEKFYAQKDDFSAQFVQTVVRAHLPDRPAVREGRFYFKKPGLMRFDYLKPDQVHYVSDGTIFWNYIPESNLAYRLKVENSELFYALKFLYGQGSLAKDFLASDGGMDKERRIIVLKPSSSQHNFQQVRLFVSPATSQILETEVTDPAGNVSRLVFNKISFQVLPKEGFQFTPPEGVQIEDLDSTPTPRP